MESGYASLDGTDADREAIAEARGYWLDALSDGPTPAALRPDRLEGSASRRRDSIDLAWPEALAPKLLKLAKGEDTLLYAFLLCGLSVLLYKYGGESDFIVCSPAYAGLAASRETSALLPIRCRLRGGMTVKELLTEANRTAASAYRHQYYPVWNELSGLGIDARQCGKIGIGLANIHGTQAQEPFLGAGSGELTILAARDGSRLKGHIDYDASLFGERSVHTLADAFAFVLEQMAGDPDAKLETIELVRSPMRNLLLTAFARDETETPEPAPLHRMFEEQAARTPGRTAVVSGSEKLTYGELDARANLLADRLRRHGAGEGRIVGIMLEKSVDMVTSILAAMKAGSAYLPLDSGYPEARLRHMALDSGAAVLLTSERLAGRLAFAGATVLIDAFMPEYGLGGSGPAPERAECGEAGVPGERRATSDATADQPAYVIYTSGSTGTPKGVLVSHRGMASLRAFYRRELAITENDRIVQFASASFDASIWELSMALLTGAELHLPPQESLENYDRFADYLNGNGITVATLPPAFAAYLDPERVPSLRLLITAGSAANPELVRRWKGRADYVNAYGPTEATICATIWRPDDSFFHGGEQADSPRSVPIGRPIPNVETYVLGPDGRLQPVGVAGELYIGGIGVAIGYLGKERLTAEKFVPNPFRPGETMYRTGDGARWLPDGNIDFLGRLDRQFKIRGYRIEAGEIEAELLGHPALTHAAVAARSSAGDGDILCAYFVSTHPIGPHEIKAWLAARLPAYMIPQHMMALPRLPLTVNGKVDYDALPSPRGLAGTGQKAYETEPEAGTETERKLARLWDRALGGGSFGAGDNFFEAGGHSLRAALLIAEIHRTFRVQLTIRDLMEAPTLRRMAGLIDARGIDGAYETIPRAETRPHYPLSAVQRRLYVLGRFFPESVAYNLPAALRLEGALDTERLRRSFEALADRHETLRTSFGLTRGIPVQFVHALEEIPFEIEDAPPGADDPKELEEEIRRFVRPFDPGRAPLFRIRVIRYSNELHVLLTDIHHLISDGISTSVFIRDLLRLYAGDPLTPLPLQYKDYACWQSARLEQGRMEAQERYWLSRFRSPAPTLGIRTDYPRPQSADAPDENGDAVIRTIPAERTEKLRERGAAAGATLYMVLLSAYSILLSRYAGQEDIVIGTPVAGRRHADLQELIGMFVNMLPMRLKPEAGLSFSAYLDEVKETALQALEHQDYPFDELVRKLGAQRDFCRNPLFDASFALQNMDMTRPEANGLAIAPVRFRFHPAKFDLTLWAEEADDGLRLTLEYRTALFKQETAERMMEDLSTIIARIEADAGFTLGGVALLCDDDRKAEVMRLARLERDLEMKFDL